MLATTDVIRVPVARLDQGGVVKVRFKAVPHEREIDGVRLDQFRPGMVSEVSSSIASWLIAQGYADPEMRQSPAESDDEFNRYATKPTHPPLNERRQSQKS
jgi:hypothetical protein